MTARSIVEEQRRRVTTCWAKDEASDFEIEMARRRFEARRAAAESERGWRLQRVLPSFVVALTAGVLLVSVAHRERRSIVPAAEPRAASSGVFRIGEVRIEGAGPRTPVERADPEPSPAKRPARPTPRAAEPDEAPAPTPTEPPPDEGDAVKRPDDAMDRAALERAEVWVSVGGSEDAGRIVSGVGEDPAHRASRPKSEPPSLQTTLRELMGKRPKKASPRAGERADAK